jgi:mono/diheme cytochrome c family protein
MDAPYPTRRYFPWALLGIALGSLLTACGSERRGLREWQPSDHPAPPAVAPEGQGRAEEGPDAAGRAVAALWSMRCASCHGETGHGDGAGKPPGAPIPDMTQTAFQTARTDAQIAEVVSKGRGLMPAFGEQITEAGIAVLVGHVRSLGRAP